VSDLVPAPAIEDAATRLRGIAVRTPLLRARWAEAETGTAEVGLKCESLQRGGAFKFRGAYNLISRLPEADRKRGVVTHSSGNHAQGVAAAAGLFGIPCVVVMPTTAPAVKVEGARRLGAEIVFEGTTSLDIERRALVIAEERRLRVVEPFDHPDVVAGQGTVGLEILEDRPDVEDVLVPVGGGGLVSGIGAWVKRARPGIRLVGVEPEGADALRRSLEAGRVVTLESAATIADGLKPLRPCELTLAHARAFVDAIVTVSDEAILAATRRLLAEAKLVVEFSGAAAVAALLSGRWTARGRRVVAVLSGGNLDPARIAGLMKGGPTETTTAASQSTS
jgi:threonine dehydratase